MLSLEEAKDKGKGKLLEADTMPVKRARREDPDPSDVEERRGGSKTKENGESSKRKSRPRRYLNIEDFLLGKGSEPYDLVTDVGMQGPKITWPQLLHLAPKVRRQWSKMVSTRRGRAKPVSLVRAQGHEDVVPIVDAHIKGQRVSNVYVDGGAQMCVLNEKVMHRLGLKVDGPSAFKAKMANNATVRCLGVINNVRIKVCGVEVEVDMYVMPSKGEGYPIILGRPWLIAMKARQDWERGVLELNPHRCTGRRGKSILYNMKEGRQENLELETSVDEISTEDSSSTEEETSEEDSGSSMEVMGLVLKEPPAGNAPDSNTQLEDERLGKMLAKDLPEEEREPYLAMLRSHSALFITEYNHIKGVEVIKHHIHLKEGIKPVAQKLRRLGTIQQNALLMEVKKLLQAGFIYPVEDSEWVSPVVVTPKKNGKWRVCVDYKPLNAATKRDHFPLPFQDEILNEVAGHERYTVCDGYSGYFQIRIAEEDQRKTTFITPWGCFAYRVMPFGLTNAPATFQRFVTHVFQPYFGKSIRVFIDDFCIYSSKILHLGKVEEGLSRLEQMGGQLNLDKCHVGESKVTLLGHVVSEKGIEADPGKIQALIALPSPTTVKELISFIQKVRYLSRFIHLLSQVVLPLQQLTHQDVFTWSEESEQRFQEVKELLISLPTISPPCWEHDFYVNPSVGIDTLGAVLMQKDAKTLFMRPIYFSSRVMTVAEKGYAPTEQMVLALMFAVGKFRPYLLPRRFFVITVEDTFPYVLQHMDVSARISKWLVQLQEFDYTVMVESSTRACLADVLTHRCYEKKISSKPRESPQVEMPKDLENAHILFFDGAYKRKTDKAAAGVVILDPLGDKLMQKGFILEDVHSNNEAEYAALTLGLTWCIELGLKRLNVKGDAMLLIRQIQGTWACKNSGLAAHLKRVRELMKKFKDVQVQHVPRDRNKEADALASEQLEVFTMGAISIMRPQFQGSEKLHDIMQFLETGECQGHLTKSQRRWLVRKAVRYRIINEDLYCKGKDLVLRKVPLTHEIELILSSCHDGVCGGHFAQEITSRKILQAGFVWPSLHRDVQHWCRTCKACQKTGMRKLTYEPQTPIISYGPFDKWGIDAIGPLPRTQSGKEYIIMGVDYMTRWAEAVATSRITASEVGKFIFESICCRFGAPLEIISDRGPGFRSDLVGDLMRRLKIERRHSSPYYPQCNGLVEKVNGMISKIITKGVYDRPKDWDKHLNAALWAYRTSFKTSLGFTPFHLVYGQEALLPIELELASLRVITNNSTKPSERLQQRILDLERLELDREEAINYYAAQAEKRRKKFNQNLVDKKLKEGMLVLRYDNRFDNRKDGKLLAKWEGPFLVLKRYNNGSYQLQDVEGKVHQTRVNGWRLKPYFQRIGLEDHVASSVGDSSSSTIITPSQLEA